LPVLAALPVAGAPAEPAQLTTLAEFVIASVAGQERQALERVADAVEPLALSSPLLDRVKTAVAEAAMNAIEHGNGFRADQPVGVTVRASPDQLVVAITDQGGARPIPAPPMPDLDAKLAGRQTARGWGLFLIQHMVDDVRISGDGARHTVELVFAREGTDRDR
jgi:anti-sigma regulatory factor (Ser/Thr protein kinase)